MYFIRKLVGYIQEKAQLNQYAIDVKEGNLLMFDEVDKEIRPHVKKMTYRHSRDPHFREDLEQAMMEFSLYLCMKYERKRGDFENYCLRSVYFELMKHRKRYFEQTAKEFSYEGEFNTVRDELAHYETYEHVMLKDSVSHFLRTNALSEFEKDVLKSLYEGKTLDEIATRFKKDKKAIQNTLYRIERKKTKSRIY